MICGPIHRGSITLAIVVLSLLLAIRAEAHLPSIGLGLFYDGILHLLLGPEDLIPVIALTLLPGQRGAGSSRRILWILPVAWLAGGLIGMFIGTPRGSALTCFSFLALATLLGFFHGQLNGSGINRFNGGAYSLLALALAVFVIVALFTSLVIPLRRQWALIVVRVAGSWIPASGLLMLGWTLR